ncbi:MAG: 1,4-dihydroxy-2-naphthoate polyprenyltransferase [Flavobacteriales bacterium]|nr:1,4-dihydroxy-2-naphthoate polyprenyltransferase [Flavobacteriales bacterium]
MSTPTLKDWLLAFRLRTLPLAASSILVGSALAAHDGNGRYPVFILALLTALLLQVLSNLANDLGDHAHGTDNAMRVGPPRAVQSGAITPAAMRLAMVICAALVLLTGIALITTALGAGISTLIFFFIGLAAIGAAVKYTFGRNPYGYAGLGDVSVLLFFGLVGVMGTYYLHSGHISLRILKPAITFGLWSAAVLNVNNMRDVVNDAACGKRTLAVRLGLERAKTYHEVLLILGALLLSIYVIQNSRGWSPWLFAVGLIPLAMHATNVQRIHEPTLMDPELKRLALAILLTAVAFSAGLILA